MSSARTRSVGRRLVIVGAVAGMAVLAMLVWLRLSYGLWRIPQNGMAPGMPAGTTLIGERSPYDDIGQVRRGDVIIYEWARDGTTYVMVWRVIGLPGERIEVRHDVVWIDGEALAHEPVGGDGGVRLVREGGGRYTVSLPANEGDPELANAPAVTLDERSVFVMGDNRHQAVDSRATGAVPLDAILARVVHPDHAAAD